MDIVGDRKFVEVPGGKTHELPPLLVKTIPDVKRLDKMVGMAADMIDQEDMLLMTACGELAKEEEREQRRMDLALNLVNQYMGLLCHWHWGDSVVEWIRQCEITFGARLELRNLLRSDVWPYAGAKQLCAVAGRQGGEDRGRASGKGSGSAAGLSANAADTLLHRSVFVLPEQFGGFDGVQDVADDGSESGGFVSTGAVSFRYCEYVAWGAVEDFLG